MQKKKEKKKEKEMSHSFVLHVFPLLLLHGVAERQRRE